MAVSTPWLTSNDLIESVKRKISLPTSQATYTDDDILKFANEEMDMSQVPAIMEYHEDYFVYPHKVPLLSNTSRYTMPDRTIGMKMRDLMWSDASGNLFEMTRVSAEDKAFFQRNVGANSSIHKYYLEGNDIVLTPQVITGPTGSLVMYIFLRPNRLVRESRSAIISKFLKGVSIEAAFITEGDTFQINNIAGDGLYKSFVALSSYGPRTISSITTPSAGLTVVNSTNHKLQSGFKVNIVGSGSNPSIDGTYTIEIIDNNSFIIPKPIATGSGGVGSWTSPNQFLIGSSSVCVSNLISAINSEGTYSAQVDPNVASRMVISYTDFLNVSFNHTGSNYVFNIEDEQGVRFNNVPVTDTDPVTYQSSPLFVNGKYVDFLQYLPGHKTRAFNILIPTSGATAAYGIYNSTDVYFDPSSLPTSLIVGDYMALAGESIIPQIPPELHSGLAERTANRILASQGDLEGLQVSSAKIKDIIKSESTLIDNRIEGSNKKINGRLSILRFQGIGNRRRV